MPKIVDKDKKRTEILHAAMKVLGEKGVKKTRMIDIAREAGIGKGTVYEYFRNQDDVVAGVFDLYISELFSESDKILHEDQDPLKKLKRIFKFSYDAIDEVSPELMTMFMDIWIQASKDQESDLMKKVNLLYAGFIEMFSDLIEEGISQGMFRKVDSRGVSSAMVAIIDGVGLQQIIFGKSYKLKRVMDTAIDMILEGIVIPGKRGHK